MHRRIFALILGLMVPLLCLAQQPIVGTYKIVSYVIEIDGQPREIFGKSPRGYAIVYANHADRTPLMFCH